MEYWSHPSKLRRYSFCIDTVPFLYRSVRFGTGTAPVIFSGIFGRFLERTGVGPVSDRYLLFLYRSIPVLYRSFYTRPILGRVFYKRTGVMHRYWTGKRPILHRYFVTVQYRSLPFQYRSFSPVLEREFSGLFCPVPFPVLTVPFRSVPFRSVPIPLHCTVEKKPPQLSGQ